jgi:PST family polysaccharide transporter
MHTLQDGNKQQKGRLWENVVSLYVLQGLNYIIPMAILPYLVRTLGMEFYGLTAVAQSFSMYAAAFTDYGFNFSATRAIAQQRDNPRAVSQIFSVVFTIKLLILCMCFIFLVIGTLYISVFRQHASYFFAAYVSVIGWVLFPLWLFQGMEEMRYVSIITGLARIIGALALFVVVRSPRDAVLSIYVQSLTLVISGLFGLLIGVRRFNIVFIKPAISDLWLALRDGWHIFMSVAAITVYTNTNIFFLGMLSSNVEAGYYSAAEKIVRAIQGVIGPITQALFPHMNVLAAQSRKLALQFVGRVLLWVGGAMFIVSSALLVFARPLVMIYLGHRAAGSVPVIEWIAFLPFIVSVSNLLGIQTMIPFRLDKYLSGILVGAGVLHVLVSYLLTRSLSARGAAMSLLITEVFITAATVLVLYKKVFVDIYSTNSAV